MASNLHRVVLDSNILVSAYVFGGKPETILESITTEQIKGVTSQILISELLDVLRKKFAVSESDILPIQSEMEESFEIVYPKIELEVVRDVDDNRVLETAVEGKCQYIVTGDKELLELGSYQKIKILTAAQFLSILEKV